MNPLTVLINARGIHAEYTWRTVDEGGGTVLMSSHVMDDVQEVCDRVVLIRKGQIVVNRPITDLADQIEKEVEAVIWGGASKMEEALISNGLKVRRMVES